MSVNVADCHGSTGKGHRGEKHFVLGLTPAVMTLNKSKRKDLLPEVGLVETVAEEEVE
jgi:hypothetical protein